jgi:GT2 family glycosyltransferase
MSLSITVAIATLGRVDEVIATLEGVLGGSLLPKEILVSDQNQPPILRLDEKLKTMDPRIRHIRCDAKGVVFNMNTLLREASGDVVLFVDDDVVLPPTFVEAHLACYSDPTVFAVAGRVEQPQGDRNPKDVLTSGGYNSLTGQMTFEYNGRRLQRCSFAQGCNMSFVRQKLIDAGGFDEGFIGNGYFFETEAGYRFVKRFPGSMLFSPEAELKHLAAPRGGARITDKAMHLYYFMRNGMRFYRRHGTMTALFFQIVLGTVIIPLKAIYNLDFRIMFFGFRGLMDGMKQDMSFGGTK